MAQNCQPVGTRPLLFGCTPREERMSRPRLSRQLGGYVPEALSCKRKASPILKNITSVYFATHHNELSFVILVI